MDSGDSLKRRLQPVIESLLRDEPVIAVHGPRTVGKSTIMRALADVAGRTVVDLDDRETRVSVEDNLSAYVSGEAPVFIDEYQHFPPLLDAIKAELNRNLEPGRFVLTGSTRYSSLPAAAQSLTGRLHIAALWPLSQGEIDGVEERFVEQLLDDPARLVDPGTQSKTSRQDYVARILRGGLPLAVARRRASRGRWFDDYVQLVVERDVIELSASVSERRCRSCSCGLQVRARRC